MLDQLHLMAQFHKVFSGSDKDRPDASDEDLINVGDRSQGDLIDMVINYLLSKLSAVRLWLDPSSHEREANEETEDVIERGQHGLAQAGQS